MVKSSKRVIVIYLIHFPSSCSFLSLIVNMAKICFCFFPKIGISQVFFVSVNDTIIYPVFQPLNPESSLNFLFPLHCQWSPSVGLVCCTSKMHIGPGWCGSVDWVPACILKGRQFDSQSGLWARSLIGGVREAINWCFSLCLSPSLPISLKINKLFQINSRVHVEPMFFMASPLP